MLRQIRRLLKRSGAAGIFICALFAISVFGFPCLNAYALEEVSDSTVEALNSDPEAVTSEPGDSESVQELSGSYLDISLETDKTHHIYYDFGDYPVKITILNNSKDDFYGVVKLLLPLDGYGKNSIALAKDIYVPSGKSAQCSMHIDMSYIRSGTASEDFLPFRVDLLDNNGILVCKEAFKLKDESESYDSSLLFTVITANGNTYDITDPMSLDYGDPGYNIYGNVPDENEEDSDAPDENEEDSDDLISSEENVSGYSYSQRLNEIKLSEVKNENLEAYTLLIDTVMPDKDSWNRIREWTAKGGYLILKRDIASKFISLYSNESGSFRYGAGKILIYDEKEADTKEDIGALCKKIISYYDYQELISSIDGFGYNTEISNNIYSCDIIDASPVISRFFIIFLIYIILTCNVSYYYLRRKDKLEMLWLIVPICSVLFSVIVYMAASDRRMSGLSAEYFSNVLLSNEGTVERTCIKTVNPTGSQSLFSIYSADDVHYYQMSDESETYYSLDNPANETDLLNSDYKLAIADTSEGTDIVLGSGKLFTENTFVSRRYSSDSKNTDRIIAKLTYSGASLSGKITNNTFYDLDHVFVYDQGFIYYIGHIDSLSTVQVNEIKGQYLEEMNFTGSGTNDFVKNILDLKYANDAAALEAMYELIKSASSQGDTYIGGFSDEYNAGLDEVQFDKFSCMALLHNYCSIDFVSGNRKSSGVTWGFPASADDDDKFVYPSMFLYDDINLVYQFDPEIDGEELTWLNPQGHRVIISVLNQETGKYDEIMSDTVTVKGKELKQYLDDDNQMKVKVKLKEGSIDTQYYDPAFDLSGGVIDDTD